MPRPRRGAPRRQGLHRPRRRHHQLPIRDMTETVSVIVPAFNESASIEALISGLRRFASWHEILVVDDGSTDDTGPRAARAGARVVRHPYNKGNGAAVKTGIRQATGPLVLILDADGQHRPRDAPRLVSRLGTYEPAAGARSHATQPSPAPRVGNPAPNRAASY